MGKFSGSFVTPRFVCLTERFQGCRRNEHLAFQYLQKAAEHAVLDLNSLSSTVNTSVSKGELIMAIYELGVSFRHGWGVSEYVTNS